MLDAANWDSLKSNFSVCFSDWERRVSGPGIPRNPLGTPLLRLVGMSRERGEVLMVWTAQKPEKYQRRRRSLLVLAVDYNRGPLMQIPTRVVWMEQRLRDGICSYSARNSSDSLLLFQFKEGRGSQVALYAGSQFTWQYISYNVVARMAFVKIYTKQNTKTKCG